ncbi:FCD domain-containing protein [Teredinibacter turnerae]|uniref:FadR/GntR family transcriptional regulator n=1 Tax=Teredinibacter turnerae TaxID=2426 RepID=UPI001E42945F|nr:FCD domain-containing protein [Teredinibacter turnerae]
MSRKLTRSLPKGHLKSKKADILAALERKRQAELGNDDALESDIEFHTTISLASGNRFFIQLRDFIETALRVSITLTNRIKNVHLPSFADHKRVCDPIISGNQDSARTAIKALLNEAIDSIDSSPLTRAPLEYCIDCVHILILQGLILPCGQ